MNHRPQVTIIGKGKAGPQLTPEVEAMAEQAGRLAAEIGFVVVTGGMSGVMLHAAKGASEVEDSTVVGILPTTGLDHAHPYCNVTIPTNLHYGRNVVSILAGDCVVALPGSHGTLQEMSFAITYGRPVFSWDSVPYPIPVDSDALVVERDRSNLLALETWLRFQYDQALDRIDAAKVRPWAPVIPD